MALFIYFGVFLLVGFGACVSVDSSSRSVLIQSTSKNFVPVHLVKPHEDDPQVQRTRNPALKEHEDSRAAGAVPQDNGGNYGDLVHQQRANGDVLLYRETLINPPFNSNQDLQWQGEFRTSGLTEVRALNFGRERGYCYEITTNNNRGIVDVLVRIPRGNAMRMIIEVYGLV